MKFATAWMNLKTIMLNEVSYTQKTAEYTCRLYFLVCKTLENTAQSIVTENRSAVAQEKVEARD